MPIELPLRSLSRFGVVRALCVVGTFPDTAATREYSSPTTEDLGMNERTETLTRLLARDQSPMDP